MLTAKVWHSLKSEIAAILKRFAGTEWRAFRKVARKTKTDPYDGLALLVMLQIDRSFKENEELVKAEQNGNQTGDAAAANATAARN
jgi:hypothetical protein